MHRLSQALADQARAAGATVLTGQAVTAVSPQKDGWQVSTPTDVYAADEVVLAVAVPAARTLLPQCEAVWGDEPERHVTLVTLVLDAPALDSAPRGTGVLAQAGVTRAKALTHATAKWPWLAARTQGAHIVRLSYAVDGPDDDMTPHALADASRLLGVPLTADQVRGMEQVCWPDASPVKVDHSALPAGVTLAGSAAGLSGLAAIVAAGSS